MWSGLLIRGKNLDTKERRGEEITDLRDVDMEKDEKKLVETLYAVNRR